MKASTNSQPVRAAEGTCAVVDVRRGAGALRCVLLGAAAAVVMAGGTGVRAEDPFATVYARALEEAGIEPTREGIAECLKRYHPGAQTEERFEELIAALGDDDFFERESAMLQLLNMDVPPEILTSPAASDDPEIAWRAGLIVQQAEQQRADKRRSDLLYKVFVTIAHREIKGLAGDVLQTVPACQSSYLRQAMERALTATVTAEDADLLRTHIAGDDAHTRHPAVRALAHALGEEARDDLLPLLKDGQDTVRLTAAEALLEHGSAEALTTLGGLLESNELAVRNRSIQLLRSTLGVKLPYSAYGPAAQRQERAAGWRRAIEEHLQEGGSARTTLPEPVRPGHLLVAIYQRNRIIELDAAGEPCFEAEVPGVADVQMLPDDLRLAVSYKDSEVRALGPTGELVWKLDELPAQPIRARHLPTGETLVTTVGGSVLVFDRERRLQARRDVGGAIQDLDVAPEGGHILVADSSGGRIVELGPAPELEEVWRSPAVTYPCSVSRCDDGRLLVASFRTERIYVLEPGGTFVELDAEVERPRQVQELADGTLMALDATGVHILDGSGRKIRTVYAQEDVIRFHYSNGVPLDDVPGIPD